MSAKRWVVFSFFLLLTAALLAAVLTPSIREGIQKSLSRPGRDVLATAEGDVLNENGAAKVIKYRDDDGIFVEVMRMRSDGSSELVQKLQLPDRHDGLFNFQGHVTRLAIADIDDDGKLELLAPTFDQQLVPHLNVFRYNADLKQFVPYQVNP